MGVHHESNDGRLDDGRHGSCWDLGIGCLGSLNRRFVQVLVFLQKVTI